MSWLDEFEGTASCWDDEIPAFGEIERRNSLLEEAEESLSMVFGTLDDMALSPELMDSDFEEVHPEFRHPKRWSKEEDDLLAALSEKYNQNWSIISNYFPYKKPTRVIKRWMLKHDPSVVRSKWTPEEDQFIVDWYIKFGGNWQLMAKHLKGRLPDCIKNRFYGTIKKKLSSHTINQIKINKQVYGNKKTPRNSEPSMNSIGVKVQVANMKPVDKTKRVDELQRKMAAIEVFISKTKKEIRSIKMNDSN